MADGFFKLDRNHRATLFMEITDEFREVALKNRIENQIHAATAFRALAAICRSRARLPDRNSPAIASSIHF